MTDQTARVDKPLGATFKPVDGKRNVGIKPSDSKTDVVGSELVVLLAEKSTSVSVTMYSSVVLARCAVLLKEPPTARACFAPSICRT